MTLLLGLCSLVVLSACTAPSENSTSDANRDTAQAKLSAKSTPKENANVILILADDLGYTDVVSFAEKVSGIARQDQFYETPNIDALADQGLSFTHAYVNPLCSPTRASLLTGKPAVSMGFTTATSFRSTSYYGAGQTPPKGMHPLDVIEHKDKISIEQALINARTITGLPAGTELDNGKDELTYAELMTRHKNAFLGKWHLGGHGTPGYQPQHQGFEELSFFDGGASSFFNYQKMWNTKRLFQDREDKQERASGKWESLQADKEAKPYLTDALTDEAEAYIRQRAKDGKPFTLFLSHFAVHAPIQAKKADTDYFAAKPQLGTKGQDNPTYAAMVKSLDDSVGQIVKTLYETGLDENTYIIFMSDNGGVDWLLRGSPTPPTSNQPFTGGKATVYEGGVRVPLVIWKKGMHYAQDVSTSIDVTDIMPTLLDLGGYQVDSYNNIKGMAGQSLVPFLSDTQNTKGTYTKDTIYWYYPFNVIVNNPKDGLPVTPHAAIKKGDYKLIVNYHGSYALYNVMQDIGEKNDLAAQKPELANRMFTELVGWIDQNAAKQYRPLLNSDYNPDNDAHAEPFKLLPQLEAVCCETD